MAQVNDLLPQDTKLHVLPDPIMFAYIIMFSKLDKEH